MTVAYFLLVSVLVCVSSVDCTIVKPQCSNCSAQHIKFINATTGRCVVCWPCPKCNEGLGLSIPCGATVTVGTNLECILCVPGKNFSGITGTSQCQSCGVCSGKHESVHSECTREKDVMCKCDVEFFRNKTTQECLPCASCCSGDQHILENCKRDGAAIIKKCKFEDPWPSTCLPSLTAVGTIDSISVSNVYLSVLATSSSLISYSYRHSTPTPRLGTITKSAPVPSETGHIEVTSASFSRPDRHTKISEISTVNNRHTKGESSDINIVQHVISMSKTTVALISVVVFVLATGPCVALWLYHKYRSWQAHNNPHALQMTFHELEARDNEERKSSECSGAAQPLIHLTEHPPENTTSPILRTDEGMRLLPDIPTSLENEPQNLAKRTKKRLASEGDDNSAESDLEGSEKANQRAVSSRSAEPPIQSTEDNGGYNTHIKDVPESFIHDICMLLDEWREIDSKDYRLLASELGLPPTKIRHLKELKQMQGKSPSYVLLTQVFSAQENLGTLHHLRSILKKMERFDVIKVLDDWVLKNS